MLSVEVSGKHYDLCNDWQDITLEKFGELIAIEMPLKLKNKWLALLKKDDSLYEEFDRQVQFKDVVKSFPEYYGKILSFCSTIPQSVVDNIDWKIREQLFNEYFIHFCMTSLADFPLVKTEQGLAQYDPVLPKSFEFEGKTFFLPESLDRGGKLIPLGRESIVTFSEAADIEIALNEWSEKGIDSMAQVTAVYCLLEGEKHSDELVMERTEIFKKLPMSTVWEVFFCIVLLGLQSLISTRIFLKAQTERQEMQPESQGS
jgi:hypothetical protein